MASSTARFFSSLTTAVPLRMRDTVLADTPAAWATICRVVEPSPVTVGAALVVGAVLWEGIAVLRRWQRFQCRGRAAQACIEWHRTSPRARQDSPPGGVTCGQHRVFTAPADACAEPFNFLCFGMKAVSSEEFVLI